MAGGSGGLAARKYIPRGHPVSWMMLVVTTGAILINSIDRAILPTVLPGILNEFGLSESGFLVGLSFAGTAIGGLGLMIGIGLGASGLIAAPIAGILIQDFGFTVHYVFIACICLLALVPISMIRETATLARE